MGFFFFFVRKFAKPTVNSLDIFSRAVEETMFLQQTIIFFPTKTNRTDDENEIKLLRVSQAI